MKAYIKAISYILPDEALTNEDLSKIFPEWNVDKISSKVGISKRFILSPNKTALDMAESAALKLFVENNIDKGSVDFILYCTQSPDYFLPTSACILQDKLGLSTRCGALDFNLGCSGYVYGLALAKGLIASSIAKNVLLVTSETYSKYIHPQDKRNRSIFGDAATASLISKDGFAEILDFDLGTDGSGAENLIVRNGASKNREKANDLFFDEHQDPYSSDYLFMDGSEIFTFTLERVPELVKNVLTINNLKKEDIDLYILHQANKYMLEHLRKKLKITPEQFYIYMENVGNTVSSTIPIALYEAAKEKKLLGNILLAGFGVGYSWGGTILKCEQ